MRLNRRGWVIGSAALVVGCSQHAEPRMQTAIGASTDERFAQLERETGGRFGVAAWDLASNRRVAYRQDERFLMCSTFKFPLAGAVLHRVEERRESLTRRVQYDASALLPPSPITGAHVGEGGLTVEELCAAMVTVSDNAAANLMLETLGGPRGLTAFFRAIGDNVSRLDRNEPEVNAYAPGDERDTTTARAMLQTTHALLVSERVLSLASRQHLGEWLAGASTGLKRLRSAFPKSFRAGDKTGTGDHGATNDVAIAWRANAPPVLVTAYSYGLPDDLDARSEVIGRVGRIVVDGLGLKA